VDEARSEAERRAPERDERPPSPSPWAPPAGGYEPPGPVEPVPVWDGPSAFESAREVGGGAQPTVPAAPPEPGPPSGGPPPLAELPDAASPGFGSHPATPFDAGHLLPARTPPPSSGARRAVHRLTGGRVNLGPSAEDRVRQQLLDRARTPAATGRRRIAMVSLKGGVGKTTTTVMLGHTLATVRGDNVIAVDANPDAGNLASRVQRQTDRSARDLLHASGALERYADVRAFTSQASSRLEVLAGDADPALSEAFSAADYEAVLAALERFYSIVLTDCGTGILHDAMRAVLWYADQLVVVTSPSVDAAQALGQLLDWLDQHGYHHLVQGGIVAVNGLRKRSPIRADQFAATFGTRCRDVIAIPYDAALSTGGESELEAVTPSTQRAYLQLAAAVGDGFSQARQHGHDPRSPG
jgi:MinD-like ATPase involved in chromosome partitioning or flagellar assembly